MRLIAVQNGWRLAPHQWWRFILTPVNWDRTPPTWWCLSVFGFVFFFDR